MKIKHASMIMGLILAGLATKCHAVWDTSTPAGTEAKSQGDDRIREFKTDVQTALNTYGVFPGTDTANPKFYWTVSSGTTSGRPANSVSTGTIYINISSGCIERYAGVIAGWTCIQTVNPSYDFTMSTLTLVSASTKAYDLANAVTYTLLKIQNNASDTDQMTSSIRFIAGNADEAKIVAIRDTSDSAASDLAINVRRASSRFEPQRWKSDGTVIFNSSNTYRGTNLFQSSATFNAQVAFNSSIVISGNPVFFITQSTMVQTNGTCSTNSSTYVDCSGGGAAAGQFITITPSKATSRIHLTLNTSASTATGTDGIISLFRDAVDLAQGAISGFENVRSTVAVPVSINYVDIPGDTSSHTYSVRLKGSGGNTTIINGLSVKQTFYAEELTP